MSQPSTATRPALPRTVWILGVVSLLMDLSSEIYHALLPAFLTITLGLPVAAMGALDGLAEATANIAKLGSGALSDRQQRRKPWILLGYGLAALSKPLFPLASGVIPVLGARFIDRVGKGIRGAPRDAMIADETPRELRGRAFGLRQSMDTVGAFLAPLAAVGLMLLFAGEIRTVFWIPVIPAAVSFLFAWAMLREAGPHGVIKPKMKWGGFRSLDARVKRLLKVGFLFGLARFSESFLILKAMDAGVTPAWSPLVLALFNLAYLLLAYPAGILSDRIAPRSILVAGIGLLVAADLVLANAANWWIVGFGVVLWGGHMALSQGIF
ncbi:MAG: MFS transporter, partial [Pseudomonadota bacterium]|nr:MFS transporter [Pseudomonadota bacterium]